MSSLIIYRASAGSGKTFRLAAEYLKQVLHDPSSYRRILAVTFTNKATAEMKGRILSELFALAHGSGGPMAQTLQRELSLPMPALQGRAKEALGLILHDYSRFSVSTIDSFVQRVIQALLWELGEQGGVRIELDYIPILEHAADSLLDSASESPELMDWLLAMGRSQMDQGKGWDVRGSLIELGRQLFNESFRLMSREEVERLTCRQQVQGLREALRDLTRAVAQQLGDEATGALAELERRGLAVADFLHGQRGVMGFFVRCTQAGLTDELVLKGFPGRAQDALGSPTGEAWVAKSVSSNPSRFKPLQAVIGQALHPSLQRLHRMLTDHRAGYLTARMILKNMESLALIGDLWHQVRALARQEGFLLLADSNHLLRELVGGADAPFVFERVGSRFDTLMVDEFQDTSVVQWHNLRPLIENSLAQDRFSMVVGDVKQSIYRWRNGDWRILASGVERDFAHQGVDRRQLADNRRSLPAIVEFNNLLFAHAVDIAANALHAEAESEGSPWAQRLREELLSAYSDVRQNPMPQGPEGKGFVRVSLLSAGDDTPYPQQVSQHLVTLIQGLRPRYRLGQMAILVRTNAEAQQVANALLEHNRGSAEANGRIDFVSQEALLLGAASVVRTMVAAFTLVQDSGHEVAQRALARELAPRRGEALAHPIFTQGYMASELAWLAGLHTRPLLEAFEAIARRYSLSAVAPELPYLAELHEQALTLASRGGTDASAFLTWWEQTGRKLSLSVPESPDALSIITIHKSKGLQYPVVIIPYASWPFRPAGKPPLLWLASPQPPFNALPRYPITLTREAAHSLFAPQALEERMQELADNLNLLYVAFTRAQCELHVYAPEGKEGLGGIEPLSSIDALLRMALGALGGSVYREQGVAWYAQGDPVRASPAGSPPRAEGAVWLMESYPTGGGLTALRIRREALDFFRAPPPHELSPLAYGKLMHSLFARIQTHAEVDQAIGEMVAEGLIGAEQRGRMAHNVRELLAPEPMRTWFAGPCDTRTERTIITPQGLAYRPDRVMLQGSQAVVIDLKFGEPTSGHLAQVRGYIDLLQRMGYSQTQGHVWYVDAGRVEDVG